MSFSFGLLLDLNLHRICFCKFEVKVREVIEAEESASAFSSASERRSEALLSDSSFSTAMNCIHPSPGREGEKRKSALRKETFRCELRSQS